MTLQLFFLDTETTGLTDRSRIIQFGGIYGLYDGEKEVFHDERIINQFMDTDEPIDPGAHNVHRIDKEKISIFTRRKDYLREILSYIKKSDYIIGHNIDFDMKMLKNECRFEGIEFDRLTVKTVCTMKSTTELCKIDNGKGGYKRPKLNELHKFLFDCDFEEQHDALSDIKATKDCFLELYNKGKIVLL